MSLLSLYRSIPMFKGKFRIGSKLFSRILKLSGKKRFKAHYGLTYEVPNTQENLGAELLINGVYEKETLDFIFSKVKDGETYFDVGANIGALALPVLKARAHIKYFGFEASPFTFSYLRTNLQLNDVKGRLLNMAVHETSGETLKFYHSELYGKSALSPTYAQEFVEVPSISLDEFCRREEIAFIDWLKVDVQGFELFVFKGAKELLSKKAIRHILFECEGWAEQQAEVEPGTAVNLLRTYGYDIFDFRGSEICANIPRDGMYYAKPK